MVVSCIAGPRSKVPDPSGVKATVYQSPSSQVTTFNWPSPGKPGGTMFKALIDSSKGLRTIPRPLMSSIRSSSVLPGLVCPISFTSQRAVNSTPFGPNTTPPSLNSPTSPKGVAVPENPIM